MWPRTYRDEVWSQITTANERWDLIVVGGGITGAAILAEAARSGKKALLVEAQDFSAGTSSRSTKLVHGGLRYLRQGQVFVTRRSVKERERLLAEAPGLIDPIGFSLAVFSNDPMPRWMYGLGLAMYDALAWKWAHERQSKAQLLARIPALRGSTAVGGYRYVDAQTDDCRLVLRVLEEATRQGGVAINYVRAQRLLRTSDGTVRGVAVTDTAPFAPSRSAEIEAKVVINATGAWADDLRVQLGQKSRLRKIRGSHLTFASSRLPISEAVSLVHPRDQRAIFAVPWEGVTIFGTTDVDHPSLDEEPAISASEFEYLLEAVHAAFPQLSLTERDVLSTWSGVRPVIGTGKSNPSKESREHALWKESGLITISGGKLTTFAAMARDALIAAETEIGALKPRGPIFEPIGHDRDHPPQWDWPSALNEAQRLRLVGRFGRDATALAADSELATPIPHTVALWSEVRRAARSEAVVTLCDLLLRRVRLGIVLPNGGLDCIDEIKRIAQPELGWDNARWEHEVAQYNQIWLKAYSTPR